jgi:hypothetical protein
LWFTEEKTQEEAAKEAGILSVKTVYNAIARLKKAFPELPR